MLDASIAEASAPEVLEPVRRQLSVAHRVLDVLVPEICLQRARVVASIGELEPAGMAKHVWVDREGHASTLADAPEQGIEALGRHRSTSLGREYMRGWLLLTLQAAQSAQLVALQRMHTRRPVLDPAYVQADRGQLDLMPLHIAQLRGAQSMTEGNQDHRGVAVPVTARLPRFIHQPLDLARGQVLSN